MERASAFPKEVIVRLYGSRRYAWLPQGVKVYDNVRIEDLAIAIARQDSFGVGSLDREQRLGWHAQSHT